MSMMKTRVSSSVLIGDVLASRAAGDRRGLHRELEAALAACNVVEPSVTPLAVTLGDEFQGVYASLGAALAAAWRVRLLLLPGVDTRYGVGRGENIVLDSARGLQDGSAWWAARDAIDEVKERAALAALRHVRTAYRSATDDASQPAVAAALECRDHLVGSLSARSLRLLRGAFLDGASQAQLAAAEGISPSAVSQRVRGDGIGVLLDAQARLGGLP